MGNGKRKTENEECKIAVSMFSNFRFAFPFEIKFIANLSRNVLNFVCQVVL